MLSLKFTIICCNKGTSNLNCTQMPQQHLIILLYSPLRLKIIIIKVLKQLKSYFCFTKSLPEEQERIKARRTTLSCLKSHSWMVKPELPFCSVDSDYIVLCTSACAFYPVSPTYWIKPSPWEMSFIVFFFSIPFNPINNFPRMFFLNPIHQRQCSVHSRLSACQESQKIILWIVLFSSS